ncbi:hypothetical protein DL768_010206 [Monosporascus sp. mg162]|nr:hypothetical protein DL768_010206 [Monosporascus sp. mg162]
MAGENGGREDGSLPAGCRWEGTESSVTLGFTQWAERYSLPGGGVRSVAAAQILCWTGFVRLPPNAQYLWITLPDRQNENYPLSRVYGKTNMAPPDSLTGTMEKVE